MNLKRKVIQIKISLMLILFTSIVRGQELNTIYLVNPDISVIRSVSCDNFESSFIDVIIKIEIKKQNIEKIVNILKSLPKLEKAPYIDVRYKGIIQSESDKFVFCGDEGSININGNFHEYTPTLDKYFRKLRYQN